MSYVIDEKTLRINNQAISFDHLIRTVVEKDGIYVVLIMEDDIPGLMKHYHSRNIFGVNEEGEIIWQVEAPTKDPVDLYTGLFEEEGKVIGYCWKGFDNYLDPQTGKILDQEFTK